MNIPGIDAPVIYQHPLAYLLGLEGIALLRAFSGVYDRDFTIARLREIRALLDSVEELGDGVEARPITTSEGYARWAAFYDEPGNQLLDLEQPLVREILDSLPLGVALDAACGTGRHSAYLASLGHKVIGVDTSPGEPFDIAFFVTPSVDFYDPYAFLNLYFESRFIGRTNSSNLRSARWDRRLRAASRLRGRERLRTYGRLDADLVRDVAPVVPLTYISEPTLVSKRVGCIRLRPALDLETVCLK